MNFDLTHVRHDPAHCLAHGLFRSLKRGERKKLKLDITYQHGDESIRFWGPEPLGPDDLRVLQGLVAMAAISGEDGRGIVLKQDPKTEKGRQLRMWMDMKWDALEMDTLVVQGSFRLLAKELGYAVDSGGAYKIIRESIERMWAVSVIVEKGGKRQGFRILSEYASDEQEGKLFVAVNPRITNAVMGDRQHTRLEMSEVRVLRTDPARLMHQRLCGWINAGKTGRVGIDVLCSYVWPEEAKPGSSTIRERQSTIRKSLNEFTDMGWSVIQYAKGKYDIGRPKKISAALSDGMP